MTYGIKDVAEYSKRALEGGREVASKTGTVGSSDTDNSDAWMVGYTPSISTAVWMGNDNPSEPIVERRGQIIYGSGLPGAIWQQFMNTVLAGTPKEDLPDKASFQGDTGEGVPEPHDRQRRPDARPRPTPAPPTTTPTPPLPDETATGSTTGPSPDADDNGTDDRDESRRDTDGIDDRHGVPDGAGSATAASRRSAAPDGPGDPGDGDTADAVTAH